MRRLTVLMTVVLTACGSAADPIDPPPTMTTAPVVSSTTSVSSTTTTLAVSTTTEPPIVLPYDFARTSDEVVVEAADGWHTGFAAVPSVVVHEGTWLMFYSGGTGTGSLLGLATSTDGIEWSKLAEPILDPVDSQMGWMVVTPWEGRWVMWWVDGFRPPYRKVYRATATSPEGPWTEEGIVEFVPDRDWDTFVVPTGVTDIDGVLWMAYAAYPQEERVPRIGLMTSTDGGITWFPREGPVHEPTSGGWDEKGVVPANLIRTDRGLELFFLGFNDTPRVGYQKGTIPMGRLISVDGGTTWVPDHGGMPILDTGERGWPGVATAWVDGTYYVYFGDDLGGRGISLITGTASP